MANTIKHKRGSGSNPSADDLVAGELAIRTDTGVVFTKKDDGTVAQIAGGGDTDLGVSTTTTAVTVTSSTGNNATISEASSSAAGVMSAAHHDKLDGIESGATADQTASEILTLIKTVDGSGSGLDADTLDGISIGGFIRSDAADTKTSGDLSFSDSVKAKFGTGNDLEIQHNGTDSYVTQKGTGDLYLQNTTNDKDIVIQSDDGSGGVSVYIRADGSTGEVNLYHYGSEKFNTTSSGINITGNIAVSGTVDGRDVATDGTKLDGIESGATADQTASEILTLIKTVDGSGSGLDADSIDGLGSGSFIRSNADDTVTGHTEWQDNKEVRLGNGADLKLYHDGTNSYIDGGTGDTYIRGNGDDLYLRAADDVFIQTQNGETAAKFIGNGAVQLNYDNSQKFATKSDGVDITGELQCDSLDVDGVADISGNVTLHANLDLQDNDQIRLGSGDDLKLYHDGTDGFIVNDTNALVLKNNANDASIYLQSDNGSGGTTNYIRCNGSTGDVILYQYGNQKLQTFSSGVDITGELQCDSLDVDGAADITGTVTLHGNLDLQDSDKILLGSGDDLQIYHDGSHSYIYDSGSGNLKLRTNAFRVNNAADDENIITANQNAEVNLFYNNANKLQTKSDGVNITGELQCDTLDVDGNGDIAGQLTVNRLVIDDDGSSGPTVQIRTDDQSPWAVQISNDSWSSGSNRGLLAYQANDGNFYTRLQGVSNNWEAFYLQQSNGSTTNTAIEITLNREVALRYQNSQKLITKSDGVDITGELQCDSLDVDGSANVTGTIDINGDIRHNGDVNCLFGFPSNDTFRISTGGTERFRITSTGAIAIEGSSNYGSSGQVLTSNGNDAPTWQDGGGTVASGCVYENSQTISSNYSVTSGKNAMSAGPITIASGVTVTVTSGSTYTIV
jgi:cytoskeletal protein CcmA (bactofilin family)